MHCLNCGSEKTRRGKYCSEVCYRAFYGKSEVRKHYDLKYRANNKKAIHEASQRYYKKHKEKIIERCKHYREVNKKQWKRWRKARRYGTGQRLTRKTIQRVYEDNIKKYGTLTCELCNKPILFGKDSLDHKTPLTRGGSNLYENLQVAHSFCNSVKLNKTMEEWEIYYNKIGGECHE